MNHPAVTRLCFLLLALILGVDATFQVCSLSLPVQGRSPRVSQSVPDAPIAQKDTHSRGRELDSADNLAPVGLASVLLEGTAKPFALRLFTDDRFRSEPTLQSKSIRLNT